MVFIGPDIHLLQLPGKFKDISLDYDKLASSHVLTSSSFKSTVPLDAM